MRLVQKSFNFLYFHTLKNETHYTNGFLIADYTWVPSGSVKLVSGTPSAGFFGLQSHQFRKSFWLLSAPI